MADTSVERLLELCLRGERWTPELLGEMRRPERASAFFGTVVERLADLFEPALCDTYAELMAGIVDPDNAGALVERYRRVRTVRPCRGAPPRDVVVLSRVTLGADVAVTSVVLDAARRRFPEARIHFAGPRKAWELFGSAEWVRHIEIPYVRRGSLEDRLAAWPRLRAVGEDPHSLILDPDSRLSQLGILPFGDDERYHFFESRSAGSETDKSLPELTGEWVAATLGIGDARPWIAPVRGGMACEIAVSLGTGGNPDKRLPNPFEGRLLAMLAATGRSVLVDKGGDVEEAARVEAAIAGLPNVRTWQGDFATFAASIAGSRLYVGYDSAGQHVAGACGTPLIGVFSGAVSERFFARWRPRGYVIRADGLGMEEVLARIATRLD